MFTYHFNYLNATNQHEVRDPQGHVVFRSRIKYVALERVDLENRAVSLRKAHEAKRNSVA
jgi:hypothetical protein